MILALHQPNLLPWIGYFHKMAQADVFVLLDASQVPRGRSYATRTKINTPKGPTWLTMPTKRKGMSAYNEQPLMPLDQWLTSFWETIRHNYARAKYWNYAGFEDVFRFAATTHYDLANFNIDFILWAREVLEIQATITLQSDLSCRPEKAMAPIYYCRQSGCDTYLSGNGAREYNNPSTFNVFNVQLIYQEFKCPTYSQLWQTFQPNLSILDLIFNTGPMAKEIIRS